MGKAHRRQGAIKVGFVVEVLGRSTIYQDSDSDYLEKFAIILKQIRLSHNKSLAHKI